MSKDNTVVRTEREGRVLTVTIDREERRNALNDEVLSGLVESFSAVRHDDEVGAVVLTGAGDRAFCAGADLGGIRSDASKLDHHYDRRAIVGVLEAMQSCGKPVVARVNGHALAGGFGVMCAADLVVAAEDAEFGMPEVRSGLWPFIISAVVRTKLPEAIALELMMTGRRMSTEEAMRWGLVNRVVPRESLDDAVDELCGRLTSFSAATMKLGKDSWVATRGAPQRQAMEHLHAMLSVCLETEDVVEGITAFLEKREPVWKHR